MLYYLLALIVFSAILSFLEILPYNGWDILINAMYLATVCKLSNFFFAKAFKVTTNIESSLITGFILALIFGPVSFQSNFLTLSMAGIAAMASKYLIVWKGRHIFNPAAFGAVASALVLGQGASWWIGSPYTFPVVLLGGFLILKKIRRFRVVGVFLISGVIISLIMGFNTASSYSSLISNFLLVSPIIFFGSVMLVEPLTSPFDTKFRILYAIIVVLAFNLYSRSIPFSLELGLLTGNVFSFLVSKNFRQILKLKKKIVESHDVISFLFEPMKKIDFRPGQYLEWQLSHKNTDERGIRRYFTISSSPSEKFIMLTTKFAEKSSSFKIALRNLELGEEVTVLGLEGDFTLPREEKRKLCFIAGGIGITPFRSMVKYLLDQNQERDIILLYCAKAADEFVFKDIFESAKSIGIKTVYVATDTSGFLDRKKISLEVTDFRNRLFYISGPHSMVDVFRKTLKDMGVARTQLKIDFFPGYV